MGVCQNYRNYREIIDLFCGVQKEGNSFFKNKSFLLSWCYSVIGYSEILLAVGQLTGALLVAVAAELSARVF